MVLRSDRTHADTVAEGILQEVNDLSPWAYSYTERPDNLLEVRASELAAIVSAHVEGLASEVGRLTVDVMRQSSENGRLRAALEAYMVPAGATPAELWAQAQVALGNVNV